MLCKYSCTLKEQNHVKLRPDITRYISHERNKQVNKDVICLDAIDRADSLCTARNVPVKKEDESHDFCIKKITV